MAVLLVEMHRHQLSDVPLVERVTIIGYLSVLLYRPQTDIPWRDLPACFETEIAH